MNNKIILAFLLFASSFTYVSIANASDQESFQKLEVMSALLATKGFQCRNKVDGRYLKTGDTYTTYTTLYSENTYILAAAGNVHVKDIDIILHDENHNTIARDKDRDPTPMVTVSPRWSGSFHAKVTMHEGRGYSNLMVCWKKK